MIGKKIFVAAVMILAALAATYVGCGRSAPLEAVAEFQRAQHAFDQAASPEDFLKVAGMYQAIRDRGLKSGAVLYNQGNAFMRAGERGRAIAAYLEAKRYLPRNPYLDANLRYAQGSQAGSSNRPLIEYLLFWQNWISYGGKFYLAAAAALAVFAAAVGALFAQPKLFGRLAVAGGAVFVLLALSASYDWYRFDYITHGIVIQDESIARKGNAESYEPAFTEPLAEGTPFALVQRRGEWLLIRLAGDQEGWIRADRVAVY